MLILGLGRSAVLCNMLKLMRCNKWANPPKACPLWQKRKTFRQAWRPLCLSRMNAGRSQWISISLWETLWTWLIVRDMSPGSSPWVQEVSLWEVVSECNMHKKSLYSPWRLTEKHLVRIRSALEHVHTNTRGLKHTVGINSFLFDSG